MTDKSKQLICLPSDKDKQLIRPPGYNAPLPSWQFDPETAAKYKHTHEQINQLLLEQARDDWKDFMQIILSDSDLIKACIKPLADTGI